MNHCNPTSAELASAYLDVERLHRKAAWGCPEHSATRARHIRQAESARALAAAWLPVTPHLKPEDLRREALL